MGSAPYSSMSVTYSTTPCPRSPPRTRRARRVPCTPAPPRPPGLYLRSRGARAGASRTPRAALPCLCQYPSCHPPVACVADCPPASIPLASAYAKSAYRARRAARHTTTSAHDPAARTARAQSSAGHASHVRSSSSQPPSLPALLGTRTLVTQRPRHAFPGDSYPFSLLGACPQPPAWAPRA